MVRKVLHLEDYITPRHVDAMTKLVLATSCLVGLSYAIEFFTAFYAGNHYESFTFLNRALGPLGWGFADHGGLQRAHPAAVLVPGACAANCSRCS